MWDAISFQDFFFCSVSLQRGVDRDLLPRGNEFGWQDPGPQRQEHQWGSSSWSPAAEGDCDRTPSGWNFAEIWLLSFPGEHWCNNLRRMMAFFLAIFIFFYFPSFHLLSLPWEHRFPALLTAQNICSSYCVFVPQISSSWANSFTLFVFCFY